MGKFVFKRSITKEWFKWYHSYYFLSALFILTMFVSIFLNDALLGIHAKSVDDNAMWSNRVRHLSRLNEVAAAINATDTNLLDAGDIAHEKRRLKYAYMTFQEAVSVAHFDLQLGDPVEVNPLLRDLGEVSKLVAMMREKASTVFTEVNRDNHEAAGSQMAEMDRYLFRTLALTRRMTENVRKIQTFNSRLKMGRAGQLQNFGLAFAGTVCFILVIAAWWGKKLIASMPHSESKSIEA